MIILDFYGLPGSGKSTISHNFADMLRKKGYKVEEPSWKLDMQYSKLRRVLTKLFFSTLYFFYHPFMALKAIKCSGIHQCNFIQKIKYWINISYTLYYMNNVKIDYLIFDEGINQAIISLYSTSSMSNYCDCKKILISNISSMIINIYVKLSIPNVLNNLEQRIDGNSRVDSMKTKDKIIFLNKIENICENLEKKTLIIENIKSIDALVLELYQTIIIEKKR